MLQVILTDFDRFGEEALKGNEFRFGKATCLAPTRVLRIHADDLVSLEQELPLLEQGFKLAVNTARFQSRLTLPWRSPDERILLISRRHPFFFYLRGLLGSVGGVAVFVLFISLAFSPLAFSMGLFILGLLALLLGLFVGAWAAFEWTNDYFIITRDRVLAQRKLIGFFESRQESPISAILSTALGTSIWGRLLGFGNITVRSYTGNLQFKRLPSPYLIHDLLEFQRSSMEIEKRSSDQEDIRGTLLERFGKTTSTQPARSTSSNPRAVETIYKSGSILDLAARFFNLRSIKNGAVVYRTHWWILILKTALPSLLLLVILVLAAGKVLSLFPTLPGNPLYLLLIFGTLVSWGWWLYQYVDWHNDVYIITTDQLVDVNRKPLGSEEKRSAPVKNIQTVEYLRKGIIGLVLNFGTVRIQIGNEELTFDNVYDPAAIQAEIFEHFKQFGEKAKQAEQQKFADWIKSYDEMKSGEGNSSQPG
jgi:hypothetical protein